MGHGAMDMSHQQAAAYLTMGQVRTSQLRRTLPASTIALGAVFVGLFFGLTSYVDLSAHPAQEEVDQFYQFYVHVSIMIFVGFGFLMTFLRRYSLSAVSLNMYTSALVFLTAILWLGACHQVFWGEKHERIHVDIPLLIEACFCAGSGMIAFGAVIGKTTPSQILWLLFFQVPLYGMNQYLVIHKFKALDMGGTLVIHLFGAYYGLAASWVLSRKQPMHGLEHPKNGGAYLNDVFSMIGTLFLWLYWPSFNGALASLSPHATREAVEAGGGLGGVSEAAASAQYLSIINTVFSLMGATLGTFAMSALVAGRLNMVHVQNSTLAGGVIMGAACTLKLTPGGALSIGLFGGAFSVLGFQYITPFLDRTIGLGDTCGIHNLHGMPAVWGGLVAGLASLGQPAEYLPWGNGQKQLGWQVLAVVVTMGLGLSSGLFFGWIVSLLNPTRAPELVPAELFDDGPWWIGTTVEALPQVAGSVQASKHSVHLGGMNASMHDGGMAKGQPAHAMPATLSQHGAVQSRHGPLFPTPAHAILTPTAPHAVTLPMPPGLARGSKGEEGGSTTSRAFATAFSGQAPAGPSGDVEDGAGVHAGKPRSDDTARAKATGPQ